MRDLTTQLRSYAELLDASAPSAAGLFVPGGSAPETMIPRPIQSTWRRSVAVAAGVAAVVVAVVGGLLLLGRRAVPPDRPVATTTVITTLPPDIGAVTATPLGAVPAIAAEPFGGGFITPGGAVVEDGQINAFIESYGEDGSDAIVRHATSGDGAAWQISSEPLFTSSDVPFGVGEFEVHSAVITPDGTWVVYFSVTTEKADVVANTPWVSVIGAATAASPAGPWQVAAEPVLAPGKDAAWDGLRVGNPAVVAGDNELVMLYTGVDAAGVGRIGRATSRDGLTWERTGAPVITADAGWEDGETIRPDLVRIASVWIATFSGSSRNWRGLAYSADGLTWIKDPRNPVVSIANLDRPQLRATELVARDGDLLLLVENGGSRSGSELTVLRLSGEIPPGG